jgi:preprotein translocase subunit SecG
VSALPGHGNGHSSGGQQPGSPILGLIVSLWFLVRAMAVLALFLLLAALLTGVWAHATADLFRAGWNIWGAA